jgi:hypothetical protein
MSYRAQTYRMIADLLRDAADWLRNGQTLEGRHVLEIALYTAQRELPATPKARAMRAYIAQAIERLDHVA